jgi:hypothetical protein
MKKIKILSMVLFLAALIACNKTSEFGSMKSVYQTAVNPVPGDGNPSCVEDDLNIKVEKLYDHDITLPNGQILSLDFSDDGRFVSWSLGEGSYCLGTIIVKGGDRYNSYTYNGSVFEDDGLQSPLNRGGQIPQISHLCFSFIECAPEVVIAVKAFYYADPEISLTETNYSFLLSSSTIPDNFNFSSLLCKFLAYNTYPDVTSFPLVDGYYNIEVGVATVTNIGNTIKVTLDVYGERLLVNGAFVFIGTLSEFQSQTDCPDYSSAAWLKDYTDAPSKTFTKVIN